MTVAAVTSPPASTTWQAIGVRVQLVTTAPAALEPARRLLERQLAELDLACSRFRDDAEIVRLDDAGGEAVTISPLLADAVAVALAAAEQSDGDVDPTLGARLSELGYDRDFAQLPADGPPVRICLSTRPSWRDVEFDPGSRRLRIPAGVRLDLGATAKAWAADRAAQAIAAELGTGVLVSLGGDIAVAGPTPEQGWVVDVRERQDDARCATVAIRSGGLATSGVTARRWQRGGQWLHHVLDPRTGLPAVTPWRTVTVAGPSCLAANVASTATIVRGPSGRHALDLAGLPARLVAQNGEVVALGGWPADDLRDGA
jgi:thiamine biosynthesis lipoprotein ApbE